MAKVYIIILNYKNWNDVTDCIRSVYESSYRDFSVIVIDNNSENDSLEHIREFSSHSFPNLIISAIIPADGISGMHNHLQKDLILVQNTFNNGFGAGINPVLSVLTVENAYIWLLNPDTTIESNTLHELINYASNRPQRTIIGARIHFHKNPSEQYLFGGGQIKFSSGTVKMIRSSLHEADIDYISGTCLFTHAGSYRELGLLPEDYFLYWEETDWCYNAKQNGYSLEVCPTAVCYDKLSTSIGKSFLADYYYTKNGLTFVSKFKKSNLPLAVISAFLRAGKRVLKGDLQRANGVFSGMKAFLSGTT